MRKRRAAGGPKGTSGVRTMTPRRRSAAARIASMPTSGVASAAGSPIGAHRPPRSTMRWQSMQCAAQGSASSRSGRDRLAAADARPERARRRAGRGPRRPVRAAASRRSRKREVPLLLEDLARRRGLRAVGHLAGRDDRLAELLEQPGTLGEQRGSGGVEIDRVHRAMLLRWVAAARRPILPGSTTRGGEPMAIEIDPVCGMEVDTATSPALVRVRGHDLLVLRQGLPARVQGRPEALPLPGPRAVDVSAACRARRRADKPQLSASSRHWSPAIRRTGHSSDGVRPPDPGRCRPRGGAPCAVISRASRSSCPRWPSLVDRTASSGERRLSRPRWQAPRLPGDRRRRRS